MAFTTLFLFSEQGAERGDDGSESFVRSTKVTRLALKQKTEAVINNPKTLLNTPSAGQACRAF
jgi:hypothetical protein